jgi:Arc/MetJ-type ribon-helix-helix transcriptional regulator
LYLHLINYNLFLEKVRDFGIDFFRFSISKLLERCLSYKLRPDHFCFFDNKIFSVKIPSKWMVYGWRLDGMAGETEKITINLGFIDLGQIDLLVQEGFYSNRTDFIRTAIRNQLATHAEVVKETVARKTLVLGLQQYTRRDLEAVQAAGEKLQIHVLGLAVIADDVSPELAKATIDSLVVLGAFRASREVKAALTGRIRLGTGNTLLA